MKFRTAILATAVAAAALPAAAEPLFWSTQAKPVEEGQAMRDTVLNGFPGGVDYQASDQGPWMTRIEAELQAGKGSVEVLGALHGELSAVSDDLVDLSGVTDTKAISASMLDLGKFGTGEQKYLPWMQATYVMAANRQALQYLPAGADIDKLSYDQLIQWCKAIADATGQRKCGFPAGPKGLKHRFFEGFLLPSYTGSMVTEFRSPAAVEAWTKFRELWQYVTPASTNYGFMQEPLLTGEVWVAFDHVARLADAFNKKPDDFVAFPAPSGPKGRAYMPVLAGLAIPKTAPDMDSARKLVAYMLKPEVQIATLRATNFFPVMAVDLPDDMPASVKAFGPAIAKMSDSDDAIPALLPMGLGDKGGQFNQIYIDTFERIVLANQKIDKVLDSEADQLRQLMKDTGAPCWAPDKPSDGACPVN